MRHGWMILLGVAAGISLSAAVRAQPARSRTAPQLPPIKPALMDRLAPLEREIAAMMLKRTYTPAAEVPTLEMQIDLRVLQRWLLTRAAEAAAESPQQIHLCIRADQVRDATAHLEAALAQMQGNSPARPQLEAMEKLHNLTFSLEEQKGAGDLDALCRVTAAQLLGVLGSNPEDVRSLPAMRPVPRRDSPARRERTAEAQEPATVAALAEHVRRLNVSVLLRQQLAALADAAASPADAKDAATLRRTLQECVEVARALQANTAVTPEDRVRMEQELTEALVLFLDPRMRAAGQARLKTLHEYRRFAAEIGAMKLPDAMARELGPVFAWAQQNMEPAGRRVLEAIQQYAQFHLRWEGRPRQASTIQNLRQPILELEKQFVEQSNAFVPALKQVASPTSTVGPAELRNRVEELRRLIDLLERLDRMPQTLDVLSAFKPRAWALMERRVTSAAVLAASPSSSPARADAEKFLLELERLAQAAQELGQVAVKDLPAALAAPYTGDQLSAVESKWRAMVAEAADAGARGNAIDPAVVARLAGVRQLLMALRRAVELETSLHGAQSLTRWVDWSVTAEDLRALLAPHRRAMVAAFTGFVADSPVAMVRWTRVDRWYRPLWEVVTEALSYRDQCAALPGGLKGALAALATPLEDHAFTEQRYLSFAVPLWKQAAAGEPGVGIEALAAINRHLARSLRLEDWKEEDTAAVREAGTAPVALPPTAGRNGPAAPTTRSIFD